MLRVAVGIASVVLFAAGLVVFRIQQDRVVTDATGWMRTLSFGIAAVFVAGSVLCLVAVGLGRHRRALRPLVVGAVLLTSGVAVPTYASAAYPLVAAVWAYAYVLRRDLHSVPST